MAYNQRFLVVIKLAGKGAHKMRGKNINRSLFQKGRFWKGIKMKKTILPILALVLGLASTNLHAEDIWIQKTDMPTARYDLSTSVVNRKIYAIGGGLSFNIKSSLQTVEEYDPVTDTWTRKEDMPTGRQAFSTSVVNGKIYAIGGIISPPGSGLSTMEEYDPATDTWIKKADMPTARLKLATSVVDGKIYAIGGVVTVPGFGLSIVEEYDPVTDTWTRKTSMPTARHSLCTGVVNGKIYAIGGISRCDALYSLSTVEEYDPVTDTWTTKADMPTARMTFASSVVNGRIYAIGGARSNTSTVLSNVEEYNPLTDTWTIRDDMPTAKMALSTSVINRTIYVIGGSTTNLPFERISTVEEYTPVSFIVDFNGDGIVDTADMSMMVDYWGTDEPLYDIAPQPIGDGVVDVQDLILLAEHLFEEIFPPELVAYWKLDETEGSIAQNSVSDNHGIHTGNPTWQPDSGRVAGALQFDGIGDHITTDFVLDPSLGAFSVFAWIKGGAPGQVIISQTDGSGSGETWLGLDATGGKLMTGLVSPPVGRNITQPLVSESITTDEQWHHVGFVWDNSYRFLFVDGTEVARDTSVLTQPLMYSNGGLYIGSGKNLDAGTFFSGLIDDVRIYNTSLSADKIKALAQ